LERPQRGLVALVVVPELRRDEDLFARDPALPNRGSEVALVPIQFRGIEQAVSDLEGGRDRVAGLLARAGLPHAEPEDRHRVPVVEGDAGSEGEGHPGADGTRATSTLTAHRHDFGMSFFGSTKGFFTTVAARVPFDLDPHELALDALLLHSSKLGLPQVVRSLVLVHRPTEADLVRIVVEHDVRAVVQDPRLDPSNLGRSDRPDVVLRARAHD